MKKILFFALLSSFTFAHTVKAAVSVATQTQEDVFLEDEPQEIPFFHPECLEEDTPMCTACHTILMEYLQETPTFDDAYEMSEQYAPNDLLLQGAIKNNIYAVLLALKQGANINYRDTYSGKTALHYATEAGNLLITGALVDRDANVSILCGAGRSTLIHAVNASSPGTKKSSSCFRINCE
jgi:hypothetical protein